MDIAALTLEDQFPELSTAQVGSGLPCICVHVLDEASKLLEVCCCCACGQVRYALEEAGGDPEQAAALCQTALAGPASLCSFPASSGWERDASAAGCSVGNAALVAAPAEAPLQPAQSQQLVAAMSCWQTHCHIWCFEEFC